MNSDGLIQFLQTGFRVGVGATASLLESIQDPEKREENLADLRLELNELTQKWAEKGELTEREARNLVDSLIDRQRSPSETEPVPAPTSTPTTSSPTGSDRTMYSDLRELTAEVAALRAQLEILRQQRSDS